VLDQTVDNFFAETEQVAFCTQNVVPGIDFTNDPLLQGRNFSYLDTQLKRLGSPNFTHLPVNAPRCPVAHFQQDGHMAMINPVGRANYEPNSWGDEGGPREDPVRGYTSFASPESGDKRRVRPELFADHFSQARQFYLSQTRVEQRHIADAFTFELSKVDKAAIAHRMVATLRHVDEDLARGVADGLGIAELPDKPTAARPPIDTEMSPALSIVDHGPADFGGRRLGVLVAAGSDAATIAALRDAAEAVGAVCELVAPTRHGVVDSAGESLTVAEKLDGGPSVLFDAVAVVLDEAAATALSEFAPARTWVADAHAHGKFIATVPTATALFEAAGIAEGDRTDGYRSLASTSDAGAFIDDCASIRCWDRQLEQFAATA
jgi:catalase